MTSTALQLQGGDQQMYALGKTHRPSALLHAVAGTFADLAFPHLPPAAGVAQILPTQLVCGCSTSCGASAQCTGSCSQPNTGAYLEVPPSRRPISKTSLHVPHIHMCTRRHLVWQCLSSCHLLPYLHSHQPHACTGGALPEGLGALKAAMPVAPRPATRALTCGGGRRMRHDPQQQGGNGS